MAEPRPGSTRDAFFERHPTFVRLNEVLGYHIREFKDGGKGIALHLAPMFDFSTKEKIANVLDGMRILAGQMRDDPAFAEAKAVTTTSWIVAEHPELIERFGFHIRGPISPEDKARVFPNEAREVHWAIMFRDEFLNLYGGRK